MFIGLARFLAHLRWIFYHIWRELSNISHVKYHFILSFKSSSNSIINQRTIEQYWRSKSIFSTLSSLLCFHSSSKNFSIEIFPTKYKIMKQHFFFPLKFNKKPKAILFKFTHNKQISIEIILFVEFEFNFYTTLKLQFNYSFLNSSIIQ